jgi:hypothetical protein
VATAHLSPIVGVERALLVFKRKRFLSSSPLQYLLSSPPFNIAAFFSVADPNPTFHFAADPKPAS